MNTPNFQLLKENLDGLSREELETIGFAPVGVRATAIARKLFPQRPKGYTTAFKALKHYAAKNKTGQLKPSQTCPTDYGI